METRASHVLIGAFTLVVLAFALLFVLWIGKVSLDREWDAYDIVFKEAVTGLSVGGAVQYNGIQVGEVRKLYLAPNDPSQVFARVRVVGDTPIKIDTKAKLTFTGLTGVAIIQLSGGTPQAPMLMARNGNGVPRIIADDSALQKLMSNSEEIITNVNEVISHLSQVLKQENIDKIVAVLDHLQKVTGGLADHSGDIGQTLTDLKNTMAKTEHLVDRLDAASSSAKTLLDGEGKQLLISARESLASVQRLAEEANATIGANRGAIDNFANQGLSQFGPALVELRATLRRLQHIADRIDDDPGAFVFGKDRPKEYQP